MRNILAITTLLLSITACQEEEVLFEKYQDMPSNVWSADNIVKFEVEITDTLNPYNVYFHFRNTTDYGWSNLHVFMTTTDPAGDVISDTLEYRIAEDDGKWTGKESGSMVNNRFRTYQDVVFQRGGTYSFTIEQAMRDEELDEVAAVGISLERADIDN